MLLTKPERDRDREKNITTSKQPDNETYKHKTN